MCSQNTIVAFKKITIPARATLGEEIINFSQKYGWACKDVNSNDTGEMELAYRLQISALAHVTGCTLRAYVGPWNAFVLRYYVRVFDEAS